MPILKSLTVALLLILASVAAQAQGNPIVQRMEQLAKVFNEGDAKAISRFYTETAVLLPPRSKLLIGRDAIQAHFARAFSAGVGKLTFRILEIMQAGPGKAIEIGQTRAKVGERTVAVRYLHVWEQNSQGEWMLSRDIYQALGNPR